MLVTTHPALFQLSLYYFALLLITLLLKFEKYKKACWVLICSVLVILATTITPVSKNLEVVAFDVGNADSFMIKTPKGKYFFVFNGRGNPDCEKYF